MKKFVVAVLKGLKREIDSVKAIGSIEVGVTCEEPNVLELDESAEELQNVFDSISGVSASRSRAVECVEEGRDRLHELVGGVPQATKDLGEEQGHSCHPNEIGRREQRR